MAERTFGLVRVRGNEEGLDHFNERADWIEQHVGLGFLPGYSWWFQGLL
jgi:hypothetical protein